MQSAHAICRTTYHSLPLAQETTREVHHLTANSEAQEAQNVSNMFNDDSLMSPESSISKLSVIQITIDRYPFLLQELSGSLVVRCLDLT